MIGNDIVDLTLARRASNWQRRGYLDKLFTPAEQALIRAAPKPSQQLWLLWSCKEAVYKAWSTEFGQRRFAPKALRTIAWGSAATDSYQATVATTERSYQVQAQATPMHVQAYTQVAPVQLQWQQQYHYPALTAPEVSSHVRHRVRSICATLFQWSLPDIQLQKNELGRPLLYYQGEPTDVYLSWAHHGSRAALVIGKPVL